MSWGRKLSTAPSPIQPISQIRRALCSPDHPITRSPDHLVSRSPDCLGFTLFEVIISITLTGFVMLSLLIGLRVANRAWRTGEARLRLVHAAAERDAFVVQQISSLVPYQMANVDPHLPGNFIVLQASTNCLRFVTSYSTFFRSRSGLVLAEYGIVETQPESVEVAVRESQVGDSDVLFHSLVQSITTDPLTGMPVLTYQPFSPRATDLVLLGGLRAAWFEYLDLHPDKGPGPVWRETWRSSDQAPYPAAIRLRWIRGNQPGERVIPIRAKLPPPSLFGQQ